MTGGGRGSGVLVLNASPVVSGNTFEGFTVGVQVAARRPKLSRDGMGEIKRGTPTDIPAGVAPVCKANVCLGGVALFDERKAVGGLWRHGFTSDLVPMWHLRRFEVERAKGGDVARLIGIEDAPEDHTAMNRHTLRWVGGKYAVELKTGRRDITPRAWVKKWPRPRDVTVTIAGRPCRVIAMPTVLGQLSLDGCNDTKPAYVLVIRRGVKPAEGGADELLWASSKIDRGSLMFATADLNGDGKTEILVATQRLCEQKGQIIIYEGVAGP